MNRLLQTLHQSRSILLSTLLLLCATLTFGGCASRKDYYRNMSRPEVERRAVRQSAGLGAGLGAIGGAAIGYYLGGESVGSALAGAGVGAGLGYGAGTLAGKNRVKKTSASRTEKQRLEALLQDARQSNAALASYNQNLESQIADLRRRPARSSIQRTYTEAVKKSNVTKSEISQLRTYAQSLPPQEQDSVLTAAANLQDENDTTVAMIAELSSMNRAVF